VAVLLAGAGVAIWAATRGGDVRKADGNPGTRAKAAAPAGFRVGGTEFCPTEAMCWGGITDIAGKIIPPRRKDCKEDHYMQTFAAIPLPGEVDLFDLDLDALMKRPDVKKACTHAIMQGHSRKRDRTDRWSINAWPIPTPAGSGTTYLHCVAGNGETRGSVF
jgi:hypothetical protein